MYGTIVSEWRVDNGKFELKVSVPVNCTATVMIPAPYCESVSEATAQAEGSDITVSRLDNMAAIEIGSGDYVFVAFL